LKPEIIYTLPDALKQITALQQAQTTLNDSLTQERQVFSRIINELTAQVEGLTQENKSLTRQLHAAHEISLDKNARLEQKDQLIASLEQELARMREQMEEGLRKGWQLQELQQMLFGKRSERFIPDATDTRAALQQTLGPDFDHLEVDAIIAEANQPANHEQSDDVVVKTSRHKKRYKPQENRKRKFATHIETQTTVVDYPGDKTGFKRMGKKTTTYYDFEPGKIIKRVEERLQYISEDGERIVAPEVTPRMVEKGIVGNTLLAHMHSERFVYYVPYYRQLQRFERAMGLTFAASTVDGWEEMCYQKLRRLLKLHKKLLQQATYIKADETTLRYVNDVGKGEASKGWLWVFLAPELKLILFEFHPTRAHSVPQEILKDFKGTLQVDGLSSYTAAFKDNEQVTLMGCLAHIRRGFKKAQKQNKALADEVLTYFNIIYRIEAYADKKQLDDEQRLVLRNKYTKPFLDKIKAWLEKQRPVQPPDTPMAKAITYACNQWDRIQLLLQNGRIEADNNSVERAIRPITLFRKNSLFAGNEHGGERAALFYSLVETCKLNGIDPFEYLQDIYNRLHDCPANELINLLPPHWKPQRPHTNA
jgi:transposase